MQTFWVLKIDQIESTNVRFDIQNIPATTPALIFKVKPQIFFGYHVWDILYHDTVVARQQRFDILGHALIPSEPAHFCFSLLHRI